MDKKIKAKWVKALRSGEYQQGKGLLCEEVNGVHKFCCLGVLANETTGFDETPSNNYGQAVIEGLTGILPDSYLDVGIQDPLVAMNDTGKSFDEIADYIEANL